MYKGTPQRQSGEAERHFGNPFPRGKRERWKAFLLFASCKAGKVTVNLVNPSYREEREVLLCFDSKAEYCSGQQLGGMDPHGPQYAGAAGCSLHSGKRRLRQPAKRDGVRYCRKLPLPYISSGCSMPWKPPSGGRGLFPRREKTRGRIYLSMGQRGLAMLFSRRVRRIHSAEEWFGTVSFSLSYGSRQGIPGCSGSVCRCVPKR